MPSGWAAADAQTADAQTADTHQRLIGPARSGGKTLDNIIVKVLGCERA
jgi:hypothetical protein